MYSKMNVWSLKKTHITRIVLVALVVLGSFLGFFWVFSTNSDSSTMSMKQGQAAGQGSGPGLFQPPQPNAQPDVVHMAEKVGPQTPLTYSGGAFKLDGKVVRFLSGAIHYFRVVPEYWKQRLQLMKAAHLNAVETYVPWNLHEEVRGEFNFKGILDLRKFIKTAQELGLYVILRPGPYICSEWELGGLPSWLLHDQAMKLRWDYEPFLDAVDSYFHELFAEVSDLQHSNGGPIVAIQIENEYGGVGENENYLKGLRRIMWKQGAKELLFTSDGKRGLAPGGLPDVLRTVNFKHKEVAESAFPELRRLQPDAPLMVMEFWTGWFDHWGQPHNTWDKTEFEDTLKYILEQGASVNFYMFHGGTNFGFMNGANVEKDGYKPTITSYDYDAPISESGQITPKYEIVQRLLKQYADPSEAPLSVTPVKPHAYGSVKVVKMLKFEDLLSLIEPIKSANVMQMEMLDINNHGGQNFGFINYRKKFKSGNNLVLRPVKDRALVIVNGETLITATTNKSVTLNSNKEQENVLDLFVENMGRVNYGKSGILDFQRKGLVPPVLLDDKELHDWLIYPFEFRTKFLERSKDLKWQTQWQPANVKGPGLYSATLDITAEPQDTFLDIEGWTKGVVFVNNFNIGRYWVIGPQQTLYVPAPLLKKGKNEILVFELQTSAKQIKFVDSPLLNI